MVIDTTTVSAVNAYVAHIENCLREYDENLELEIIRNEVTSMDGGRQAEIVILSTEFGQIHVFPDFPKKKARAAAMNLGVINRHLKEGFTEEWIFKNVKTYSKLLPFSRANANILAYYLSHKIPYTP